VAALLEHGLNPPPAAISATTTADPVPTPLEPAAAN